MILVTGAAGLLGRELVARLADRGVACRALDHHLADARRGDNASGFNRSHAAPRDARTDTFRGDLLDPADCRRACAGVRAILHAAARQHHSHPPRWGRERFFRANAAMTANLVDAAVAGGVDHIVYVSSDMVYGLPPGRPLRETDPPRPIGPYGRSKLAGERICEAARASGLCVTVLRPRLIVGPGRLGVLTKLFDRIRAGRPIPMLGDGSNRYQMVSVADVAAACLLALDRPIDATFNLGSEDPPPVRDLLAELARRAGSPSRPRPLPAAIAGAALWSLHAIRCAPLSPEQFRIASVDYVLDTTTARDRLGWKPRDSDTEMLWQAYAAYVGGAAETSYRTSPAMARNAPAVSESPRAS